MGIRCVDCTKVLGIEIDSCFRLDKTLQAKEQMEARMRKATFIIKSGKLMRNAKF